MTSPNGLPAPLRRQLALLAGRVRLLRLLRGVSVLVLFLALALVCLFAIDTWLTLPRLLLQGALAILTAGMLTILWLFLVRSLWRLPDAHALAALIERRYPQLCERLTSSVALATQRDLANGSPALVALLFSETVAQTQALDVRPAMPARPSLRLAVAALAALVIAVTPALVWAVPYHDFTERLLCSWLTTDAPATVAIEPSEPRPVPTLTESVPLDIATSRLTVTPPPYADPRETPPQTLPPLTPRTALQFGSVSFDLRFTRPITTAHLELTQLTTTAQQRLPLKLSADGKHGSLQLSLTEVGVFAVGVQVESGQATVLPTLTVVADAPPLFARVPDLAETSITGTAFVWPGVRIDTPFHELLDLSHARQVPPDDRLPLRLTVTDDVGVERVELEYRINHGPVRREDLRPIADTAAHAAKLVALLASSNRSVAAAVAVTAPCHFQSRQAVQVEYAFHLAGKVKDGDVVAFRLVAVDNRRHGTLGPQTAYWPEPVGTQARWYLLHVRTAAVSLARQEIKEQQDHIKDKVEAIRKALQAEREQLAKVQETLKTQPLFGPDQAKKLAVLRQQNEQITTQLEQLADLAAAKPELRDLAERARKLAEGELHRSEQALSDAQREELGSNRRSQLLASADKELAQAQKLLDGLTQENDKLAKDRMDQQDLAKLAEQQAELARQAAELEQKKSKDDPDTLKMLEALRLEQEKLTAEMKRLTEQSPLLKAALDAARLKQAQELAQQAQDLAEKQQKLSMDGDKTFKHLVETKFAELAKLQQELAEKAAQLAQDTKAALAKVDKTPPDTLAARKAAEAIKEANAATAVEKQGEAVKELERLADDLNAALEKADDKEALKAQQEQAKQLAEAQKELQEAVRKLGKLPEPELKKAAEELARKQADVAEKTAGLMKQLDQLGKDSKDAPGGGKSADEAAEKADKAGLAMKKAQAEEKEGNLGKAQQEREEAVKLLGKAAMQAKEAAEELTKMQREPGGADKLEAGPKAGMALKQGQEQMKQAENQLTQGQLTDVPKAMKLAAQALKEAADQTAQQLTPSGKQPTGPPVDNKLSNSLGAGPGGLPNLERFGKEYKKYAGKSWGELPGELQTRLLQDLRARYGADYAELIQRYFEQLASPARKVK